MPDVTLTKEEMATVASAMALAVAQLELDAARIRAEVDPLVKAPDGEPDPVVVRAYDKAVQQEYGAHSLRELAVRFESA